MIRVSNVIAVKEVNGKEPPIGEAPLIIISSHVNNSALVVLTFSFGGDTEYSVCASDLEAAIKNARNSNRHGFGT